MLILIVAYNAETTIQSVLTRIPPRIAQYEHEILVLDDQSCDQTFERARACQAMSPGFRMRVLANPVNQGYGGNQKIGYQYAINQGFDVVVMVHGDGQYAPEMLEEMIAPVLEGRADAVFGTRMARPRDARSGGMPLYKFVGNRILTALQNRLLKTHLSEFHSGYRAYSVKALATLPFQLNTNHFHFDTEIIIQFLLKGLRITEIPIPTHYGGEICHVNGLAYAFNVMYATIGARLHQMQLFYRRQYDVEPPGTHYKLKLGYPSSHTLAIEAVAPGARVLDIGCGQGLVGHELERKGCRVQGVDDTTAEEPCLLKEYIRLDLNRGVLPFASDDYDAILMLDIIEHLDTEAQYRLLDSLRASAVRRKPLLILTTPNLPFFLIRLQLLLGQFNYGKRGILDQTHRRLFTFRSFKALLRQSGYQIRKVRGVPPPYPEAIGLNWLSRGLLMVNRWLIALAPALFSYQIYVEAVPLPTVEHLLEAAKDASSRRGD